MDEVTAVEEKPFKKPHEENVEVMTVFYLLFLAIFFSLIQ